MDESILVTIKRLLGCENMDEFDDNLRIFINGAINTLTQNGVGPKTGFRITDADETWSDFLTMSYPDLFEIVKEYIYLRTKILFDPGSMSSFASEAIKNQMEEDLWRIREQADPADYFEVEKEEE